MNKETEKNPHLTVLIDRIHIHNTPNKGTGFNKFDCASLVRVLYLVMHSA